jgi:HD-like signal output (HDOD) protein
MIDRLKKLSPAHIWLLSLAVSLVMMECIAAGVGMLLRGEVTHNDLLVGFVASLFVAGLVGGFLIFFLAQHRKIEANLPLAATAFEAQKNMAATVAPAGENTGEVARYAAPPRDTAAPVAAEKPVFNDQVGNDKENSDIKRAIKNLDVLPAMPVIAQRLLALDLATEEGQQMLLVLIGQDPQISAKILGLANSAMVGASRNITTVREAAILLGTKRVQSVATGIAIISMMAKTPAGEFNIQDLWLHGISVAFAAQGIAQFMPTNMRPHDDQIFLAGMLHDIGYLVLAYLAPNLSDKLHNRLAAEPDRPAMDVEREILDTCHDELGAELAHHWNLPEEIIAVLRYHHTPDAAGAAAAHPLARMINIAEKLLPSFGIIEHVAPYISPEEWDALGISPSAAEEVKEQVDERVELATQFASSFI